MVTGEKRSDVKNAHFIFCTPRLYLLVSLFGLTVTSLIATSNYKGGPSKFRTKLSLVKNKHLTLHESNSSEARHLLLPDSEKLTQSIKKRNLLRQQRIEETCRKYEKISQTESTFNWSSRLIVLSNPSLAYCSVPKVGNTNWKRVFMTLLEPKRYNNTRNILFTDAHRYHMRSRWFLSQQKWRLKNLTRTLKSRFKFLFVRHPLQRVLSAYRNKILGIGGYDPNYKRSVGLKIMQKRGLNAKQALAYYDAQPPTFPEFVNFVLDQHNFSSSADKHWTPMFDLCNVCEIKYDYIGKFENVEREAKYVLKKLNVNNRVSYPEKAATGYVIHRLETTDAVFQKYYTQLTPNDYSRLVALFKKDFDAFDYLETLSPEL